MKQAKTSIKTNFIYNLVYNILNIIMPLLTAPYTSRVLGVENIGIYSFTHSLVSSVIMFGALGCATYAQKEIASIGDNKEERNHIFWEVFLVKTATTLLFIASFFVYAAFNENLIYYLLQIPFFVAAVLDINWLFQGIEKFQYIAIRNMAVRIVGIILLFTLIKDENDFYLYLIILGASQLLGNLTMWGHVKGVISKPAIRVSTLKHHFNEMLVYFVPSIAYQIYAVLDRAMLGWIAESNAENGYYEQAHKIVNMVVNVITAYTVVMRSRMSFLFRQKKYDEITNKLHKSTDVIAFMVYPMTFGLMAVANGLVPWFFGPGYDKVSSLLIAFSPIFIFMGYAHLIGTHLLTPSGRQRKSNIVQCIAAGLNVVLNALLIPLISSMGATIASVVSEAVIAGLYYYLVRKEFDFKVIVKTNWKKLFAALTMFIVLLPISKWLSDTLVNSFIEVFIGLVVYILMLLVLKDSFLKETINSLFLKIQRRAK